MSFNFNTASRAEVDAFADALFEAFRINALHRGFEKCGRGGCRTCHPHPTWLEIWRGRRLP